MTDFPSAPPVAASFLFTDGQRPAADAIRSLSHLPAGLFGFSVSALPEEPDHWLELLSLGLTFDLEGLAPGEAVLPPQCERLLGLADDFDPSIYGAIRLQPASHIRAGRALLPIVRVMIGIAAELTRLDNVKAVIWEPSACAIRPQSFSSLGKSWLKGSAFPVGGLIVIETIDGNRVRSKGLRWFAGHEVEIASSKAGDLPVLSRLLGKVIERITEQGAAPSLGFLAGLELEAIGLPVPGSPILRLSKSA